MIDAYAASRHLLATATILLAGIPGAIGAEEITTDVVFRAWEARSEAVQSARFAWTETFVVMAGSEMGKGWRGRDDNGRPFPPKDTVLTNRVQVLLDGELWRWERHGRIWWPEMEEFLNLVQVNAFDGAKYVSFVGVDEATDEAHPTGFLYPNKDGRRPDGITADPRVWPFFNAYRALHPMIGTFAKDHWRVLPKREVVSGRECVVVEKIYAAGSPLFLRYHVAPELEFSILRRTLGKQGLPVVQINIDYEEHPQYGWILSKWTGMLFDPENPSRLEKAVTAEITEYEINPRIAAAKFDFSFPPGTEVIDKLGDEEISYLVREADDRRIITSEERRRDSRYEEWLNTSSGTAGLPKRSSRSKWLVLGNVGMLVLFVLGIAWMIWRQARSVSLSKHMAGGRKANLSPTSTVDDARSRRSAQPQAPTSTREHEP